LFAALDELFVRISGLPIFFAAVAVYPVLALVSVVFRRRMLIAPTESAADRHSQSDSADESASLEIGSDL
jgi:hypothetical protein